MICATCVLLKLFLLGRLPQTTHEGWVPIEVGLFYLQAVVTATGLAPLPIVSSCRMVVLALVEWSSWWALPVLLGDR